MMLNKKIIFIASNALTDCSGGVSGVNYHCFEGMQKKVNVEYLHVPLVPFCKSEMFLSKVCKALHLPRKYAAFSPYRLEKIAGSLKDALDGKSADMLFFSGFTPWCKYVPEIPYVAYNDICFSTYVDFYNKRSEFSAKDLQRIMDEEAKWLEQASCVFFQSNWGMELAKKVYHLEGKNFFAVSRGGAIPVPPEDTYRGKHSLLFISREFVPKGGLIVFDIFHRLHNAHPELTLDIIGDAPPREVLSCKGVHYHGLLHKNIPAEMERFSEILSQAMFLVHPTFKDTNPLVLSEAGYYGCPSISVRRFAIPELICDEKDGLLFDVPVNQEAVAQKIEYYMQNESSYRALRVNARKKHSEKCNWDNVVGQMLSSMFSCPEK